VFYAPTISVAAPTAPPPSLFRRDSLIRCPGQDRRNSRTITWNASSRTDPTLVAGLVVAEWEKSRNADHTPFAQPAASPPDDIDARQQAAAERWAARQHQPTVLGQGAQPTYTQTPDVKIDKELELRREGPEEDLEL